MACMLDHWKGPDLEILEIRKTQNRVSKGYYPTDCLKITRLIQDWYDRVDCGRFQRHDGSGRHRATADREDRLVVRSAVTVPDSSLSTIRLETRTRVSNMTIPRRLIE
ncbi:hypothetical protein TNCV_4302621 [Trichonephila clavipes]|nr:hypothetical protein TNCV_4302621 [Trichonephila clavipes]